MKLSGDEMQNGTKWYWKTLRQLLKRFNIWLPYDPDAPLLGVYPRGTKSRVHTET